MIKEITSRQNAFVKQLYKLSHSSDSYYQQQKILLEGEHLCKAYLEKIGIPFTAIFSESSYSNPILDELKTAQSDIYILSDEVFKSISSLKSATGIAYLVSTPENQQINHHAATVILDRLQDPGNIGTILRSASAFGFKQIIAMEDTCALWSPKVLRAAMGAHFSLQIFENSKIQDIQSLQIPVLGTSLNASLSLQKANLSMPCAWLIGHEGQGAAQNLLQECTQIVKIDQPGGEESLNAAIACSICLYACTQI